jgi:hypothetical protein
MPSRAAEHHDLLASQQLIVERALDWLGRA